MNPGALHLFDATGVEVEYMIVDRATLDVRPVADELLMAASGAYGDAEFGPVAWSNELVLHVIEFKTNGPARSLAGLAALFQENVAHANRLLGPMGAMLLPTGMHPWMDPDRETRLWPHEYSAVYEAYDRIFGCRGHGWANLQSAHINLPFADDEEFGRLHAAIRMALPILPALAASSPFVDGAATGLMDSRLEVYRHNSARVPSVCARVIPEPVYTRAAYEREILGRIYDDLSPHDPEGVLRDEFANARGAIARFGRGSIEIRVIDAQECPAADLAVCHAAVGLIRALAEGRLGRGDSIGRWGAEPLAEIFLSCVREGDGAVIRDGAYLRDLGVGGAAMSAGEVWAALCGAGIAAGADQGVRGALDVILREGCLARRILRAAGPSPDRQRLAGVYRELARCLADGEPFRGAA